MTHAATRTRSRSVFLLFTPGSYASEGADSVHRVRSIMGAFSLRYAVRCIER